MSRYLSPISSLTLDHLLSLFQLDPDWQGPRKCQRNSGSVQNSGGDQAERDQGDHREAEFDKPIGDRQRNPKRGHGADAQDWQDFARPGNVVARFDKAQAGRKGLLKFLCFDNLKF